MAARPSLRTVPADRREQMAQIRKREDDSLVAASKAEAGLEAAEERLVALAAEHQELIDDAKSKVGDAYLEVVEAFGSRARAADYLGVPQGRLQSALTHRTTKQDTAGGGSKPDAVDAST